MRSQTPLLRFVFAMLLASACAVNAGAENPKAQADDADSSSRAGTGPQPADGGSKFRDSQDGQIDLSRFLATPRAFLPVPIVITEPAIGYGGGLAGMFLRPREQSSEQGWSRPNLSAVGLFATENDTWGAFAGDASRWADGRMETLAGAGTGRINLDFYGFGLAQDALDEPVRYSLDFAAALAQGNWHFNAKSAWSFGLRYIYMQVEPKLRDEPQFPGLVDRIDVKISAPGLVVEYDSRDNMFTPNRGLYAESLYLASREELGASVDFERFQQVLMGWYPISDELTLGIRADYQWASDSAPFFLRPYVKLRGVQAMRYQGDEMVSGELEARWQFHDRWSVVAAAGYGTAQASRRSLSGSKDVGSGAIGFRYELARMFGLHVGMDLAASTETTAVYIQIGNAWFRP